ncbi:3-methyl-2-oxobutanoate hydroxymethyltransferase [Cyphellophora europaea CBS 101466]|uniref:3-methyl-2-oxobutanoate hydroxymethyltransferase n=1 Tax=Cyphellophora europaea (strain CBS 101466) TaxID=1220924 RepID=W2RT07_CYPE1|nr:3-methyl-2-oxobutanoate hydroxymethyltransferase [Cyphellophora europaea CBS 101466]ETN39435.1 3-methyl-2-oxobutanoate hydroxymethyltransferase [Cyphellophora europaea CBS 101466]
MAVRPCGAAFARPLRRVISPAGSSVTCLVSTHQDRLTLRKTPTSAPATSTQARHSSHAPSSPSALPPNQKPVTIQTLQKLYQTQTPITMLTAHDYPSAHLAQSAGTDMLLVGDSLAMVALGMPDTSAVTLDEMLVFSRAVSRAANRSFVVGDLPMGSYEVSTEQAVRSAVRMVKEGRVHAVKLEGGEEVADRVRGIVRAGISVVGHVGLTPQRQHQLGGFRVQGNSVAKAEKLWADAKAVRDAGAFMVVLEAVPGDVAEVVTERLGVPTIGIGAGKGCSGQVLVQVDTFGWRPRGSFLPKFVKQYADIWSEGLRGATAYVEEVRAGQYPSAEYEYKRDPKVAEALREKLLRNDAQQSQ